MKDGQIANEIKIKYKKEIQRATLHIAENK